MSLGSRIEAKLCGALSVELAEQRAALLEMKVRPRSGRTGQETQGRARRRAERGAGAAARRAGRDEGARPATAHWGVGTRLSWAAR